VWERRSHAFQSHFTPDFGGPVILYVKFVLNCVLEWILEFRCRRQTLKKGDLTAYFKEGSPRRLPRSPTLISTPEYKYRIFSVQVVTILLNFSHAIEEGFQLDAFNIRLQWFENQSVLRYLQHYGIAQAMRINRSNFQILAWLYRYEYHFYKIVLHQ